MFYEKLVNLINTFLLRLAMLPSGLYKKLGVNTGQLFCILKTKLIIDNRRPLSFKSMGRQRKKTSDNSSVSVVLMSLFSGLFFLFSFAFNGIELQMTMYFSFIIFMLASILITDFTAVLIDVRDNYIILPKPVNDRTVVLSRLLHILLHILKIVIPMTLPGIIGMAVIYGLYPLLIFILLIFCCTLFTIFLINLVYIFILKIVSPSSFKTVLSYIQIILAVFIYGSYQFVPRMMDAHQTIDFSLHPMAGLLPSYWFAAAMKVCTVFGGTAMELICTVAAFLLPVVALYFTIKYLAPAFNRKISLINAVSDTTSTTLSKKRTKNSRKKRSYSELLANVLTNGRLQRMGFLFSWKIGNRSKDFIMKVYPSFGYILVLMIIMLFGKNRLTLSSIVHLTPNDKALRIALLCLIYFMGFILITVTAQIAFSEKYKAAWLFFTTPVMRPGEILLGSFKSIIAKFYMPVAVLLTLGGMYLYGWRLLPNLLLGFSNVILLIAVNYKGSGINFPFSGFQDKSSGGANFLVNIFKMFLFGFVGILHYLIFTFTPVVYILLALSLIANWLMADSIRKVSWKKMLISFD